MKWELTYTRGQKVLEILSLLILLLTGLWMMLSWAGIPKEIPTHFGFSGQADAWGGKNGLLIFLLIEAVVYAALTLVSRCPKIWNTPVDVTEKNRDFVYRTTLSLLCVVKLVILCMFSYTVISSMAQKNMSGWTLPVFLLALLGSIVYFMVKCVKGAKALDQAPDQNQSAS